MGLITSNSLSVANLSVATSLTNVLVYDSSTGGITYTGSSAIGGGGGGGTPGGSNTHIQFNSGSTFSGSAHFAYIYESQSLQHGYDAAASGQYSHAEGNGTEAIGNYSHAEGNTTQAIGEASHAEGDSTQAIGNYSHAEGFGTQAIGVFSHAEGDNTQTGTQNAYSASVVSGVVTLSGSYGNVPGDFGADSRLYLYDQPFDDNYGIAIFIISRSYYSPPNTKIELYDTSVTTTTAYVGDLGQVIINWGGDQIIPGDYSHAEGNATVTVGDYSHVEGYYNQAVGEASHAEGFLAQAIGDYSHVEGRQTQAIGDYSHAESRGAIASGPYSHAEGHYTQAIGDYSHAEGYFTQAIGEASHAEGLDSKTGVDNAYSASILSGVVTLSGSYGNQTTFVGSNTRLHITDAGSALPVELEHGASTFLISQSYYNASNTIIELYNTSITVVNAYVIPTDYLSTAEGDQIIPGDYSHAEGDSTQAIGYYSHAEGGSTQAIGSYSHAEGLGTQAIGKYSHAEGLSTQAIGSYSHAEGLGTVASGSYQHVQGQFNISSSVQSAFIIGNGSSTSARRNLVFAAGSSFQITGSLEVTGSLVIPTYTSNPSSPKTGSMYYNFSTNLLYIYNGTAWRSSSFN